MAISFDEVQRVKNGTLSPWVLMRANETELFYDNLTELKKGFESVGDTTATVLKMPDVIYQVKYAQANVVELTEV